MGYPYDPYGRYPPPSDPTVAPIPYPEQYPYAGYPQHSYYPPPPRRSRAPLFLGLAFAAVMLIALAVAIPLVLFRSEKSKPPPTASLTSMLVEEDDFGGFGGGFTTNRGEGLESPVQADPSACAFLATFQRPSDAKWALARWDSDDDNSIPSAGVMVEDWSDDHLADQAQIIANSCASFSYYFTDDGGEDESVDVDVDTFTVDGAAAQTIGTQMVYHYPDGEQTYRWYETIVRETTVRVSFGVDGSWSDNDERDAVTLLNRQIAKVRDAD